MDATEDGKQINTANLVIRKVILVYTAAERSRGSLSNNSGMRDGGKGKCLNLSLAGIGAVSGVAAGAALRDGDSNESIIFSECCRSPRSKWEKSTHHFLSISSTGAQCVRSLAVPSKHVNLVGEFEFELDGDFEFELDGSFEFELDGDFVAYLHKSVVCGFIYYFLESDLFAAFEHTVAQMSNKINFDGLG